MAIAGPRDALALSSPEFSRGVWESAAPAPFGGRASAGHFACKRLFDLVFSFLLLGLLLPLLLIVALVIKIDSRGPILFTQRRTRRGSQTFKILKFRTMTVREDGICVVQATPEDVRVTRVGRFLRKTSIDELPQLLNVLAGDMSLVGPRPHALAHDAYYGCRIPEYDRRFSVRPGLTGLAQVSGLRGETHDIESMKARIEVDLAYIEQWSIRLDLQVLIRTVGLIGRDDRAY